MRPDWLVLKTIPKLNASEIHVWRVLTKKFVHKLDYYWQILSKEEQQQAKKFIQLKHQERFIITHGILRQVLASYLNTTFDQIKFTNNKFGKPLLVKNLSNKVINFNISHSKDVALFCFAKNSTIGIDVEFKRQDIEIKEIAKRFFTAKENTSLDHFPEKQKLEIFFTYWTCKEAFIKAIGKGLSYPLNKFEIDVNTLELCINDPEYQTTKWSLIKFEPYSDYAAAIAIANYFYKIKFYSYYY